MSARARLQAVAHVVLRVRLVRLRAAGRVHGARGRAVLRARLPAPLRRALRLLPAVHLREGAAGTVALALAAACDTRVERAPYRCFTSDILTILLVLKESHLKLLYN